MKRLILIFCCLLLLSNLALGQRKNRKPNKPGGNSDFLKTQWWLGIRGGINLTNAQLIESFPGFYPINYDDESLAKEYKDFSNPGFHIGLDVTFYHAGFSIATQPSFIKQNITYSSMVSWVGNTEAEQFESTYNVKQGITIIDLPVLVKYDILSGKIRPFVMAGAYYGFIFDANKTVKVQETDYGFGSPISYERTQINLNNKDQFKNTWGLIGGLGASFDYWNIRTVVDVQYRHSFSSIVDPTQRFQENAFSSFGELPDDFSLQNFAASLSFVFPLRYIDSQFKAL